MNITNEELLKRIEELEKKLQDLKKGDYTEITLLEQGHLFTIETIQDLPIKVYNCLSELYGRLNVGPVTPAIITVNECGNLVLRYEL